MCLYRICLGNNIKKGRKSRFNGDDCMLCCLGLMVGYYIGLSLGEGWPILTAGIGFVVGLLGDRLWMRKMHGSHQHAMPCCGGSLQTHPPEYESEHTKEQDYLEKDPLKEKTVTRMLVQTPESGHEYEYDHKGEP